jgi:Domain of unknown function (DUF4265)
MKNETKIKLTYYDLEGNIAIESVWAEREGEFYRIKNSPFFAPNISYNDLVRVEIDEGELYFDELIKPSGHSTIHIIIYEMSNFNQIIMDIEKLNCSWEGSHLDNYISVDVPSEVDYSKLKNYLENKSKEGKIGFKEACLAHNT